ncbi:MAG: ferrous iron transport protein A [Saprospiraceae bacterium]
MKLSDLKIGQKSIVQNFSDSQMGGKLMTMGMLPGSLIELVRKASAGKTFFIKVNGFGMAVRENEAANILLEEVAN